MPFSSGTYSGVSNTFNPAVAQTKISSTDWNALLDDLEDGINETKHAQNIVQFGAVADGVTDCSAVVTAMAASAGYVLVPAGNFLINTVSISVPLIFAPGGYFTVGAAQTLTIASRVESPRQWIFRGTGTVSFTGEDSRHTHVSWFGAFPDGTDVSTKLTTITTAMDNTREATILFDQGVYRISSAVTWNRGSRIIGKGPRLTVFKVDFLTGDVFSTNGVACRFEHFQFEVDTGVGASRTSGSYINLASAECVCDDLYLQQGFVGITIAGQLCEVRNITTLFGNNSGTGSALVLVKANFARVMNITQVGSSPGGPENVVSVRNDAAAINGVTINNVYNGTPAGGVAVISNSQTVTGVVIDGVWLRLDGTATNYAVKISNIGGSALRNPTVTNVWVDADSVDGVIIENTGAGAVTEAVVNNINCMAATGTGLKISRGGAGAVSVTVGAISTTLATTPLAITGSPTVKLPVTQSVTSTALANAIATWRVVAASAVQAARNSVNGAGDATETTLATVTLPAGIMGANGLVRISTVWAYTNSANAKTIITRFGGTAGTIYRTLSPTTTATFKDTILIHNVNATNSQKANNSSSTTGGYGTTAAALITSAIDTTATVDIVFRCNWAGAVAGETIALESYLVEVFSQA